MDHLVSLIGAFFGIPLSFIIPSICHTAVMDRDGTLSERKRFKNRLVAGFGVVVMFIASGATLASWNDVST
ncbi:hypothetical protein TeGR_g13015 [Tetraparma gracilis]|uniref:Amino acid transporter transmembrane domain-containing protein n=1 Tax=Tetraparma gracilis TaxID=2962635 RepID=A0ABQ6M8W1_9STRA|nr:hypothetical protein TeGR_g13015 [Tetraparma gracilis]